MVETRRGRCRGGPDWILGIELSPVWGEGGGISVDKGCDWVFNGVRAGAVVSHGNLLHAESSKGRKLRTIRRSSITQIYLIIVAHRKSGN